MWGRRCLRASVRRNECGVQLGLDRQFCDSIKGKQIFIYTSKMSGAMTWQWASKFRSSEVKYNKLIVGITEKIKQRQGGKLTNRTEVEEERQFSSAGQAGVGLAQFIEEGVRTCLQGRQPRHRRVFQQSRAEGNGLWWGTRFKHLTGGRNLALNKCSALY